MVKRDFRTLLILTTVWLLIAVGGAMFTASSSASGLEDRTTEALAALGVDASVDFDGRDGVVRVESEADPDAIASALVGIDGIRSIDVLVSGDGEKPRHEAPAAATPLRAADPVVRDPDSVDADAPRLVAQLESGTLTVTASVPDERTAARITAIAETIYSPYVETDIAVDASLTDAAWTNRIHDVISLFPIVGSGRIDIAGDSLLLVARAPAESDLTRFVDAVTAVIGVEPEATRLDVTGLRAPRFGAVFADGTLILSGVLPSEDVRQALAGAAVTAFGEDALVDEMTVGTGLDTPFWTYRVPLTLAALTPFSDWVLSIENGITSGWLRGGANFASGSSRLSHELTGLLDIAAGMLAQDRSLSLVIEGHTDSLGAEADNLALSARRARAAADYLIGLGIDPERVDSIGYGESRPVASNDTAAGKESNRRVEFVFSSADG